MPHDPKRSSLFPSSHYFDAVRGRWLYVILWLMGPMLKPFRPRHLCKPDYCTGARFGLVLSYSQELKK